MERCALGTREIVIDPEIRALIPPLSKEERRLLKKSIKREGCRDRLILWSNTAILLDGHHRWEICEELDIPYGVDRLGFKTREEAINWVINNQLGRRNLSEEQKSMLRGKRYKAEKKQGKRSDLTSGNSCHKSAAEELAEEYKVSPRTIRNDEKFADAVDSLAENVGPETRDKILTGDSGLSKKDVVTLGSMEPEEQREIFEKPVEEIKEAAKAEREKKIEPVQEPPAPDPGPEEEGCAIVIAGPDHQYDDLNFQGDGKVLWVLPGDVLELRALSGTTLDITTATSRRTRVSIGEHRILFEQEIPEKRGR